MKRLLTVATLIVTIFAFAQTPSSTSITFTQQSYELTEDIAFTLTYSAGTDANGMAFTMANARAVLATRNIGGGGFLEFNAVAIPSINDTPSGTDVALTRTPRGGTFQTSAELAALPTPREHVMYIQYETSEAPGTQLFGTSFVINLTAPSTIVDAWEYNFTGDIIQEESINIPVIYTSADPIATGGIRFDISSDTSPFSTAFIGTYENTEELPAGTNVTTNIVASNFAAIFTLENVDGGTILATTPVNELLERNPNSAQVPNPNNAFFRLQPLASNDPNFEPSGTAIGFRGIAQNPTLNKDKFSFRNIKIYPNPSNSIINIVGLKDIKTITLYNVIGQQVKMVKNENTVNVSNLKAGVYFLKTDNGLKRKIVIN